MDDRSQYIDIFFRNGLKEFEVLPPPEVWDNVKPVLGKRRRSLIFLRVAAAVAILVSFSAFSAWLTRDLLHNFSGLSFSLNQDVIPSGSYIAKILPVKTTEAEAPGRIAEVLIPDEKVVIRTSDDTFFKLSNNGLFSTTPKDGKLQTGTEPTILPSGISELSNTTSGISFNLPPENSSEEKPAVPVNRWTISALASPNYYSSMKLGADRAATDLANKEKPGASYSGGMAFAYKVNKRLSVQSGVYYSAIGQKVTGINSYSGFGKYNDAKGSSQFSVQTSSGTIVATNPNIYLRDNVASRVTPGYTAATIDPAKASLPYVNNFISQNFNYLEIPVLFRYKALDRKIDVNFVGGLSYNMLIGNSASATLDGVKYSIGKTEGLSPVNFSSSFGLGFEYNFSKKISIDLEPTFRYYLTPLGGAIGSSIHPYSFGDSRDCHISSETSFRDIA